MAQKTQDPEVAATWEPIDSLKPWAKNPRKNDGEPVDRVAKSIQRFGFSSPIVVRAQDRRIIAGHTRWKAARQLGMTQVPVRFLPLDEDQAAALALADNRLTEITPWDDEALADVMREIEAAGVDMDGLGWTSDELDALLEGPAPEMPEPSDDVPEVQDGPADSVVGQVYELGPHRLICGDSLNLTTSRQVLGEDRPHLILNDPPYGMNLDTDYQKIGHGTPNGDVVKGKKYRPVIGDDQPFDARGLIDAFSDVAEQFWWGADYYRSTLPDGGSWAVWDKRVEGLENAVGNAFELCWMRQKHKRMIFRYLWSGFTAKERNESRVHPTQKPIGMISEMIETWSNAGAVVLDHFGGSGTTLLACAKTGRVARLIELDPHYCDVIRRRWTAYADEVGVDAGPGALR